MSMTKKDYELIAQTISDLLDDGDNDMLDGIGGMDKMAKSIADALTINPKFDRNRFMGACGLYDVEPYKCACGRINDTDECDECGFNH